MKIIHKLRFAIIICALQLFIGSKDFAQQLSLNVTWKQNSDATSLAFADNETLLTGGATTNCYPLTCGQVKTWHFKDSTLLNSFSDYLFGKVNVIKPSAKTKTYTTGNGSVYCYPENGCYIDRPGVFDLNLNGSRNIFFNPGGNAYALDKSPDETTIAVGTGYNNTGAIMVYDKNYNLLRTLDGHQYNTTSVVFTPDNKYIISGGYDGFIKFWNYQTGALIRTLTHGDYLNGGSSLRLSVSPDGKYVASTGDGYNLVVKVWRIADAALLKTIPLKVGLYGTAVVQFSPDGKYLACATVGYFSQPGYVGKIFFWNTSNGKQVLSYTDNDGSPVSGGIKSIAFSPDGRYMAYGLNNSTFKVAQIVTSQNLIASANGNSTETGNALIANTRLFPNPAKQVATLQFVLQNSSHVELALYDAGGRKVKIVSNEFRNAGAQTVNVNVASLTAGMYFINLRTGNDRRIVKLYKY